MAVIEIGGWTSNCGSCRRGADYSEPAHTTALPGWGGDPDPVGCGEEFTAVRYTFARDLDYDSSAERLRADLPVVF